MFLQIKIYGVLLNIPFMIMTKNIFLKRDEMMIKKCNFYDNIKMKYTKKNYTTCQF